MATSSRGRTRCGAIRTARELEAGSDGRRRARPRRRLRPVQEPRVLLRDGRRRRRRPRLGPRASDPRRGRGGRGPDREPRRRGQPDRGRDHPVRELDAEGIGALRSHAGHHALVGRLSDRAVRRGAGGRGRPAEPAERALPRRRRGRARPGGRGHRQRARARHRTSLAGAAVHRRAREAGAGVRETMKTQAQRADAFRALHERPGAFIIPNPWDAGTAKLLASLGFEALATTSLGLSNTLGRVDGTNTVSRAEVLANCRAISEATDLPVNADLENGYADEPRAAAEMIRLAGEAGVVGGSIEDATGDASRPIYDFALAVERVQAAVEVARSLPFRFMLTARAENMLHGRKDLDDTIKRLQAFGAAGADVLYAPGLYDLATIKTVVSAIKRPFNLVMGFADPTLTLPVLSAAGVKRVSVGGAMARVALAAFMKCAREMKDQGCFTYVRDMAPMKEV